MAIALQQVEALLRQSNEACEILIVSDSQVTLTGLRNVAFLRQQTTRRFVRQPEATVLCVCDRAPPILWIARLHQVARQEANVEARLRGLHPLENQLAALVCVRLGGLV